MLLVNYKDGVYDSSKKYALLIAVSKNYSKAIIYERINRFVS